MILEKDAANLKSGVKNEIASIADVLLQLLLLMLLKIRYPTLLIYSKKKQIMIQKKNFLRVNVSQHLIIINSQTIYSM